MNVFLIDDDPFIKEIFRGFCELHSHQFAYKKNGIGAANKALETNADVVFLDMVMEDKEGFETLRELKLYCADLPIYTISGEEFYLDVSRALGACGSIKKPIKMADIECVINGQSRSCVDCVIEGEGLGRCGRKYSANS